MRKYKKSTWLPVALFIYTTTILSITSVSTTDAVAARDFAQSTPRRARHTRRWRGLWQISVSRFNDRLKMISWCANAEKSAPDSTTENIGFDSRADAREKACQALFFDAVGSSCRVDTRWNNILTFKWLIYWCFIQLHLAASTTRWANTFTSTVGLAAPKRGGLPCQVLLCDCGFIVPRRHAVNHHHNPTTEKMEWLPNSRQRQTPTTENWVCVPRPSAVSQRTKPNKMACQLYKPLVHSWFQMMRQQVCRRRTRW